MRPISPAVERACESARGHASGGAVALGHWLLALTDDEESKPSQLLARAGFDPATLRELWRGDPGPEAPAVSQLMSIARPFALEIASDSTVTTDSLLLAVLAADDSYAPGGLTLGAVEAALYPNAESGADAGPVHELVLADVDHRLEAARVVDANLNRVREGLRVLEDYARFSRGDALLVSALKSARHRIAEAEGALPAGLLLAARDTRHDVGTAVSTASEYRRDRPEDVAVANVKRAQESLRSLEEFGKLLSVDFARQIEQIRYTVYTLERYFVEPSSLRSRLDHVVVYALLSGKSCVAALDWTIAELAGAGVGMVQLREKELTDAELIHQARRVRRYTLDHKVLMIVNDRPDIARLCDADGVHLGQDDMRVADARRVVGPDATVGVSTHSFDELTRAELDGADYVGVGPVFPSRTKEFDHFPGLDYLKAAVESTRLPAFALGGIELATLERVVAAGGRRVAVSSALTRIDEPGPVAAQMVARLRQAAADESAGGGV